MVARQVRSSGKAFFCNSGTEANEAAFKLARLTGRRDRRRRGWAFTDEQWGAGYDRPAGKRALFEPMPPGVRFVPYGDADALDAAVTDRTAAVIFDPIQGEAGVISAARGLSCARQTDHRRTRRLLILDEVQTGVARTGHSSRTRTPASFPDVLTPPRDSAEDCRSAPSWPPDRPPTCSGRVSTAPPGGNPVAAAAALAVINTIDDDGLTGSRCGRGKDDRRRYRGTRSSDGDRRP